MKQKLRDIGLFLAAPVIAAVAALLISSLTLLVSGHNPMDAYRAMWDYVTTADSIVAIVNRAVPYYVAAVAVAIGFKMNLFNIGVDGQYRLAALMAAAVGAEIDLVAPLQITVMLLVAVSVGAAYAGIAGVLKVTRGVNEVVSTIMLNFIATGITAYLLFNYFKNPEANLVAETRPLPRSGRLPALNELLSKIGVDLPRGTVLQGFLPFAILIGVGFYILIYRTRFGFDLRTTGMNPNAARSSGVSPKAMIMKTMLLSGGVAGLAGMGPLLADIHGYGDTFPTAIGFTGIAVALLGRNSPVGIAFAAFVFAGIERASQNLNTVQVPQEIGRILQGTLLLTAVIAFEVVHRYRVRMTVKEAAARTADERPAPRPRRARPDRSAVMTDVQPVPDSGVRRSERVTATIGQGLPKSARYALYALGGFALFSLVRVLTGAASLTSGATFIATVAAASPILLAGLGGLFSERSGIVNIGLDGMMILGTWFGGWAGWHYGPWAALAFGAFGGMLGGLVHGIATITFGVNQIVSGIAINLIAPGITRFLSSQVFANHADGSITQSPSMSSPIGHFTIPGVSTFLDWLNKREWFLVSDLSGALLGFTKGMAWSTLIAWLMIPISFYLLWRTAFGLRLRSAGEKPSATDSLGVSVYRMRYAGVAISGALAGLGGAWLAVDIRAYNQDQVAGRGFQGLAALIFGNWQPAGVGAGAGLFAFGQSLTFTNNKAVLALFLLAALAFTGVAVYLTVRRKLPQALGLFIIGVLAFVYYQATSKVDSRIVYMTPYVITLLVLSFASQRLRPPAAEGLPWFKGQTE